eukprot:m.263863 g.263863  ORF g.263863 m.263863 type:complete len:758 (+) comp17615_c0_seq2:4768-7041(+)
MAENDLRQVTPEFMTLCVALHLDASGIRAAWNIYHQIERFLTTRELEVPFKWYACALYLTHCQTLSFAIKHECKSPGFYLSSLLQSCSLTVAKLFTSLTVIAKRCVLKTPTVGDAPGLVDMDAIERHARGRLEEMDHFRCLARTFQKCWSRVSPTVLEEEHKPSLEIFLWLMVLNLKHFTTMERGSADQDLCMLACLLEHFTRQAHTVGLLSGTVSCLDVMESVILALGLKQADRLKRDVKIFRIQLFQTAMAKLLASSELLNNDGNYFQSNGLQLANCFDSNISNLQTHYEQGLLRNCTPDHRNLQELSTPTPLPETVDEDVWASSVTDTMSIIAASLFKILCNQEGSLTELPESMMYFLPADYNSGEALQHLTQLLERLKTTLPSFSAANSDLVLKLFYKLYETHLKDLLERTNNDLSEVFRLFQMRAFRNTLMCLAFEVIAQLSNVTIPAFPWSLTLFGVLPSSFMLAADLLLRFELGLGASCQQHIAQCEDMCLTQLMWLDIFWTDRTMYNTINLEPLFKQPCTIPADTASQDDICQALAPFLVVAGFKTSKANSLIQKKILFYCQATLSSLCQQLSTPQYLCTESLNQLASCCHPSNWSLFKRVHPDTIVLCCFKASYTRRGVSMSFKTVVTVYQKLTRCSSKAWLKLPLDHDTFGSIVEYYNQVFSHFPHNPSATVRLPSASRPPAKRAFRLNNVNFETCASVVWPASCKFAPRADAPVITNNYDLRPQAYQQLNELVAQNINYGSPAVLP